MLTLRFLDSRDSPVSGRFSLKMISEASMTLARSVMSPSAEFSSEISAPFDFR